MTLQPIPPDRRERLRRLADQSVTPRQIAKALLVPLTVLFVGWAAKAIGPVVVTPARYERDSARRDNRYVRDSLDNLDMHEVLKRLDSRVGAIYCAQVTTNLKDACR